MGSKGAVLAALFLLATTFAAAQPRFANGNPVEDGAGNVYYSTGEYARMASGQVQYRNAGFGGMAFDGRLAFYPNGQPLRLANGAIFYQSGQVARQKGVLFHASGSLAFDASGGRYANGAPTAEL